MLLTDAYICYSTPNNLNTSILSNKKILLAVSGGIAAYKTTFLVRLLIKKGAQVKVIMTPAAKEFVTPLSLATLSKNKVEWQLSQEDGSWNNHVELGLWADCMLIAPCTANTLAKMANGSCDNLVLATYLSAKCPVYFAPAMDLDMMQHPTTLANLEQLQNSGNIMIPAESGELASGLIGKGRMAEPENMVAFLEHHSKQSAPLYQKKVLITAGPTYEKIDPVRFIGNYSSGKMGFELAKTAATLGATVVLVSGPSNESCHEYPINRIDVESALDMQNAVNQHYHDCDVMIMSAAVADYRPKNQAIQKIKKQSDSLSIELIKNPDILQELGNNKVNQILVGFALETENELVNAKGKLAKKNLDFIVLNSLQDKGAGFQKSTNKIKIINKHDDVLEFNTKSKQLVAKDIMDYILNNYIK